MVAFSHTLSHDGLSIDYVVVYVDAMKMCMFPLIDNYYIDQK